MPWNFGSVGSGAASGAATGASVGGPWGALIGGVAGALTGGFMGGPKKPDWSGVEGDIDQRQGQINDFAVRLDAARNNVLTNYKNLQTNTMNKFMPLYEARLAGRGLSASGGAFASGVANEATNLESHYNDLNTGLTESNLNTINQMNSDLWNAKNQISFGKMGVNYQQGQSLAASQGSMFGSAVGPLAGMAAKGLGSLFNRSSPTPTENTNPFGRTWWNNDNSPMTGGR